MKNLVVVMCVALLTACNNGGGVKQAIAKAYIFERKLLPGNKLLVSYAYKKGQNTVKDSAIVENKIILQDSVPISLLAKNSR
jgi:hypothetical protein